RSARRDSVRRPAAAPWAGRSGRRTHPSPAPAPAAHRAPAVPRRNAELLNREWRVASRLHRIDGLAVVDCLLADEDDRRIGPHAVRDLDADAVVETGVHRRLAGLAIGGQE